MPLVPTDLDPKIFDVLTRALDDIRQALAEPGQQNMALARQALGRIQKFLKGLENPNLGVISDCERLGKYFHRLKGEGLFSGEHTAEARESAYGDFRHLKTYLQWLENAWLICLLHPPSAERAARRPAR
jgi:hypothetical protein